MVEYKKCTLCKVEKEITSNFHKDGRYIPHRYISRCKSCQLLLNNERRRKRKLKNRALLPHLDPNYKKCTKCGEVKLVQENFYKDNRNTPNKYKSFCKSCYLEDTNEDRTKRIKKNWKAMGFNEKPPRKRKYKDVKMRNRARALRSKYNMSLEDYDNMVNSQNNKCFICNSNETLIVKDCQLPLSVDHCHKSGQIRKLLCNNCNTTLGMAKDDPSLLIAMANYIESHSLSYEVPAGWC